ncbi:tetratricopeptide repeat protein [Streptomyces lincolnensis]|uniref:tetratricopeptide repeat protein n=1 Tax=Streptomyces lincolnensis TaxID=1915 RepID=UPI001E37FACC|nr:tetratricopeptide repeat protein [Streptomyces lincolnensis]MCD7441462.1 tetratricopeptide repeat protein [Streptomyces lincolnensis]
MAQAQPTWQELIQRHARTGFVGRDAERAVFLRNFDLQPGDPRRRFRFHVHGTAGVGKTYLLQELEQLSRERGALTAYVDEGAGSVPEALSEICRQFADQGRRLKDLERRLATYHERRHEAEAAALAALAPEPGPGPGPVPETASTGSRVAVELGMGALEAALPGVSLLTRALPADRLAQGTDRVRAGLAARFRNQDDIDLVLTPEKVLTPVLLADLRTATAAAGRIVLFLDTYERTGPYLDPWLHEMVTRHRGDGGLPATVVVVTAGQRPLDATRWSGLDAVTDLPLAPFTEAETRTLLAARGVAAEPVVEEALRLTGGLPVLVSTLAQNRPGDPENLRDPSTTAVGLFLRREPEDRRETARICALPRWLDADVFRVLVDRPDDELDVLYEWLTALPFVGERGGRVRYHDVVRAQMLRLERRRSPREWARRHRRLAEAFAEWRAETEAGRATEDLWEDEEWRDLLLEETHHLLCARPPAALGEALRSLVAACRNDEILGRRWARMLEDAGEATDHTALREWGRELGEALAEDGAVAPAGGDGGAGPAGGGQAGPVVGPIGVTPVAGDRGVGPAGGSPGAAPVTADGGAAAAEGDTGVAPAGTGVGGVMVGTGVARVAVDVGAIRAVAETGVARAMGVLLSRPGLDPRGRAEAHALRGRELRRGQEYGRALEEYERAIELAPDLALAHYGRGFTLQLTDDFPAALAALDRADELAPDTGWIIAERAETHRLAGHFEEAEADFGRAIALDPTDTRSLTGRAVCRHTLGRYDEALADFNRSLGIDGEDLWTRVRRARLLRSRGDLDTAFAEFGRAVALAPDAAWVASERGDSYRLAGRFEDAVTELGRAVALEPGHASALASRGVALHALARDEEALTDLDRAVELRPRYGWALVMRSRVKKRLGDREGMFDDLRLAVEADPDAEWICHELGVALLYAGRYRETADVFRRILDLDPDDSEALFVLGAARRVVQDHTEALRYLDGALALNPDHGPAHAHRARVGLATGRTEQALADLDRCVELGTEPDWAGRKAVELLLLCGRREDAEARLADLDDADDLRVELYRQAGRWGEARLVAERVRAAEPVVGTFELAVTVGRTEGLRAARPLWRELAQLVRDGNDDNGDGGDGNGLDAAELAQGRCFLGCALDDRTEAAQGLADLLALDPGWMTLANLADILTDLLNSPDADRDGIAPLVAEVTAAAEAVRARYAHRPDDDLP